MGRTIADLMGTMSSAEFSVWQALYEEDQLGEALADFRAGAICATVANFAGKTLGKNSKGLSAADFMPSLAKPADAVVEPDPIAFFTAVANSTEFNK